MWQHRWGWSGIVCGLLALAAWCSAPASDPAAPPDVPAKAPASEKAKATQAQEPKVAADAKPEVAKELFSGKVVLVVDALKRRGIKANSEMKDQVALETASGELWPIVSDWRGRAFFQDERLRNRPVDLVVRRHPGVPYLQVLMIFTFNEQGEREYTDYWCDICSIPMYEIKACDCCQAPIRLRYQKQDLPAYVKPKAK